MHVSIARKTCYFDASINILRDINFLLIWPPGDYCVAGLLSGGKLLLTCVPLAQGRQPAAPVLVPRGLRACRAFHQVFAPADALPRCSYEGTFLFGIKILFAFCFCLTKHLCFPPFSVQNVIEVLADRLCCAGVFVPQPIAQSLEIILSDLAKHDAVRLVIALLPYATLSLEDADADAGVGSLGESPQVRILALHALCNAIKHLSSAQLLALLPRLIPAVLSSVNSALADLRKAVIFILVEIYLSVGDSVFPYVRTLTPPQRKLLTIYIEKRLGERKQATSAMIAARS